MSEDLQKKCDDFNALYPVGTEVFLLKDNGDVLETATRTAAQVLSGHSAVVWLENVTGCYLLERVRPKPVAKRPRGANTDEIAKAYRTWLASFERGRTIDVEQAFAAGYRAAAVPPMIREAFANERAEMRQLIAMLYRLWAEGDQVHGLLAVYPVSKDPDNAA